MLLGGCNSREEKNKIFDNFGEFEPSDCWDESLDDEDLISKQFSQNKNAARKDYCGFHVANCHDSNILCV